jgi:hypothetical protein
MCGIYISSRRFALSLRIRSKRDTLYEYEQYDDIYQLHTIIGEYSMKNSTSKAKPLHLEEKC